MLSRLQTPFISVTLGKRPLDATFNHAIFILLSTRLIVWSHITIEVSDEVQFSGEKKMLCDNFSFHQDPLVNSEILKEKKTYDAAVLWENG